MPTGMCSRLWQLNAGAAWRAVALFIFAMAFGAPAAPAPMYFDHFDRETGLSQLAVNALAQDATGFIWVGTEDGFDRFDGFTFRHFGHDTADAGSLPNNYVSDIETDAKGALWIATDGGGVVRQDPVSGRFEPLAKDIARVRAIRFDRAGRLWIGSRDAGVALFNPRDRTLIRFRHDEANSASLSNDAVFSLLEDRRGTLWIGTQSGLDRFDPITRKFRSQALPTSRPPLVRALLEERNGDLWIGTNMGLVRLAGASHVPTLFHHDPADAASLPSDTVNVLHQDQSGRLWIGTSGGLALFDPRTSRFGVYRRNASEPGSLPDDNIVSLYEDRSGLLWIGTKFGGLAKWNPRTASFGHHTASLEEGFASRNVMAFTEDRSGRLWVALFDGGVTRVDSATGRTTTLRHDAANSRGLSDDRVMALLTDHQGYVWAGTMSGGLDRIDPATDAVTVFRHDVSDPQSLGAPGVMSLYEDSAKRLWVGTYGGGLSRFDRATGKFLRYVANPDDPDKLASDRVTTLVEDRAGLLWVGTDGGGLHIFDPMTGRFARLRHDARDPRSLSADTVYSLHIDSKGTVWVGTRGGGLDRVLGSARDPRSIRFAHLSEKDGLPNNSVYGVHSDASGQLWVSTNFGIARVDAGTRKVRSFHRSHGLQGEEFNFGAHYASRSGQLFFGGMNGYNAFLPAALQIANVPPPIALTSVSVLNKPAQMDSTSDQSLALHLGYRDDMVTFEFAALDFAAPFANTFQYRLDGAENGWADAGTRRSVTYANLPGGHYSLHVRAANSDGVWNEAGISIAMTVAPPPWLSKWAYAAYTLLVALLIAASWRVHLYTLKREAKYSRKLEVQVGERTRELAAHASALEQANRKLEEVSSTDLLTGLGNRRSLKETLPQMIARNPRGGRLALMVVDLDCLKPINDAHGHEGGDRVLTQISKILRDSMVSTDAVVRWGGDEFVLVHACSDLDSAAELAERIRSAVATHRFGLGAAGHTRTSCSIGFALYPFVTATPGLLNWEEVLKLADTALYRAKSRRDSWVGWSGRKPAAELAATIVADPTLAESEGLLESRSSEAESSETIRHVLRAARGVRT